MPRSQAYDAVVVGGGAYGSMLARHLARERRGRIVLLEAGDQLLGRASCQNQARVHAGYHYPRSILTAFRSRVTFDRFVAEFAECIDGGFDQYYAVARRFSAVTAHQFARFAERIGAPIESAPAAIEALFNPTLVEAVFRVREVAFSAARLRERLTSDLVANGVEVRTRSQAVRVYRLPGSGLGVTVLAEGESAALAAARVYNCTYSRLNQLLGASGLAPIPLKHELAEIALVEVPEPLRRIGITVMCGPFFSTMPFPDRGLHSLSHVRYTPHVAWSDPGGAGDADQVLGRAPRVSRFPAMIQDAKRYVPLLSECRYADSLWEIKTVLPRSEQDDSRPILFRPDCGLDGLTCVAGAKIDNVYDVVDQLSRSDHAAPSPPW